MEGLAAKVHENERIWERVMTIFFSGVDRTSEENEGMGKRAEENVGIGKRAEESEGSDEGMTKTWGRG